MAGIIYSTQTVLLSLGKRKNIGPHVSHNRLCKWYLYHIPHQFGFVPVTKTAEVITFKV